MSEYTETKTYRERIRKWEIGWFNKTFSVSNINLEIEEEEKQEPILNLYIGNKRVASTNFFDKGGLYPQDLAKAIIEFIKAKKKYDSQTSANQKEEK
jgi:hypothetical protein